MSRKLVVRSCLWVTGKHSCWTLISFLSSKRLDKLEVKGFVLFYSTLESLDEETYETLVGIGAAGERPCERLRCLMSAISGILGISIQRNAVQKASLRLSTLTCANHRDFRCPRSHLRSMQSNRTIAETLAGTLIHTRNFPRRNGLSSMHAAKS